MTNRCLYILWAGLYIFCAGLGFIPEPEGLGASVLTTLSLLFFLPPAVLLYRAGKQRDPHTLKLIRNFSAASLVLTLSLILANFASLMAPEAVGNILYAILVIVSSPMVASGYWALSLFLWACLMIAAVKLLRR